MKQAAELTELTGQRQFNCEQAGDEGATRVSVCAHAHVCAPAHILDLTNPGERFSHSPTPPVQSDCEL